MPKNKYIKTSFSLNFDSLLSDITVIFDSNLLMMNLKIMINLLIALIILIASSEAMDEASCPYAFLTASHIQSVKGQLTLFQNPKGTIYVSGTYQYGFFDSKEWHYDWSIRNGCGDPIYNLTKILHPEYFGCSCCNGYKDQSCCKDSKSKRSKKVRASLDTRDSLSKRKTITNGECISSDMGSDGTTPWVIKVDDLTYDCNNDGIKYKTCDKDIYKEDKSKRGDEGDDYGIYIPKTLQDEGPETGLYLVIYGECKSLKRSPMVAPAPVNVNNAGGTVAPAPPPAAAPAAAPPAAAPAAAPPAAAAAPTAAAPTDTSTPTPTSTTAAPPPAAASPTA
ncbi:20341_t:CDS:1 [Dentiscutata erythropus]|uniref:20341_t:CDS:1 n=1 Tax=Dentiscutata erythropus TaxID=1348616 RepID=A0A9N9JH98_9GLOM|nr:20341_t:CDS:1 [Dentiscutata erythropus]